MSLKIARRISSLGSYLFSALRRKKSDGLKDGKLISIDLSIGDPDEGVSTALLEEAFVFAAREKGNTLYPPGRGQKKLRHAWARWMDEHYGVRLDPEREIGVLMGSKEGLAHVAMALLNPRDRVALGSLCYPVYRRASLLAGAHPFLLPMNKNNAYLADFSRAAKARLIFINYPNNPTGAVAPPAYYKDLMTWAKKRDTFVIADAAYVETYYGGAQPPASLLSIAGAKQRALEFHSMSKSFGLPGLRIGFVCGCAEALDGLYHLKDNYDSGASGFLQSAAYYLLTHKERDKELARLRKLYGSRRLFFERGLSKAGLAYFSSPATFYVWAAAPQPEFCEVLRERAGVAAITGEGFGPEGKDFIRFALCASQEKLKESMTRIERLMGLLH